MMKKFFILTLIFTMFLPFLELNAQQYRTPQRGDPGYRAPNRMAYIPEAREIDPHTEVEVMLPKCVKEFNLDAFEKEIVKGLLLKKFESQNAIMQDEDVKDKDKKEKLKDLNNNFFKDLSSILTLEEVEHFKLMDFTETKEEKKKKKRNRRKKGK